MGEVKDLPEWIEKNDWLRGEKASVLYQQIQTIAFEQELLNGTIKASVPIDEILSGKFDNRPLPVVLLEDRVVHSEDAAELLLLYRSIGHGEESKRSASVRLRLRTGEYHWYQVTVSRLEAGGQALLIGSLTDIQKHVLQEQSLKERAEHDAVTGIYNKQTFFMRTKELLKSGSKLLGYRIVRFDIDRFKVINELFGITEGDKLLRYIGKTLAGHMRSFEIAARMGDDVFCLCIARSDFETILFLKDLDRELSEYPLDFNLVFSAGIYRVSRYEGQPINLLCDKANLAQKTVKGSYVKRYAFYETRLGDELMREQKIISETKRALEEKQFDIYLQPQIDVRNGTLIGAEALVRWIHPQKGVIPPGDFIPIFEKNGFIIRLDEYVWERACQTLSSWRDRGIQPIPLSVNVSRMHLHNPRFCSKIIDLVSEYRIAPNLLELELTESAYIDSPERLYDLIAQLQRQGFVFAMDDFGSGYSSLSVLKDIPVDLIKIDMHFLEKSKIVRMGEEVLAATLQLARRLHLPIIAEGVETREQVDFLLHAGCTRAQGFLYDQPLPIKQFERKYFGVT